MRRRRTPCALLRRIHAPGPAWPPVSVAWSNRKRMLWPRSGLMGPRRSHRRAASVSVDVLETRSKNKKTKIYALGPVPKTSTEALATRRWLRRGPRKRDLGPSTVFRLAQAPLVVTLGRGLACTKSSRESFGHTRPQGHVTSNNILIPSPLNLKPPHKHVHILTPFP